MTRLARRHRLVGAAVTLGLLHFLDESVLRAPAGVPTSEAPSRLLGITTVSLTLAVLQPRLGPLARAVTTAPLGAVFTAIGGAHLVHAWGEDVGGADVTGVAAGLGGLVLLGGAGLDAVRAASTTRRGPAAWVRYGLAAMVALVAVVGVLVPVTVGTSMVHLPARDPAGAPGPGFDPVVLHTRDGLEIRGWYHRSTNRAAVAILNGSRGDHRGSARHALLLAAHGYGVVVYDARGTGASQGRPNGWGWTWAPDVAAAVSYLASRPEVDQNRLGILGLSTGADVALQYAAQDPRVRAVVADGATAASFADRPSSLLDAVSLWPMYLTGSLVIGDRPSVPLTDAVRAIAPRPVLLIASRSIAAEIPLNRRYAAAGGGHVDLWTLPDGRHTAGLVERPGEYADRVLATFGVALRAEVR